MVRLYSASSTIEEIFGITYHLLELLGTTLLSIKQPPFSEACFVINSCVSTKVSEPNLCLLNCINIFKKNAADNKLFLPK